MRRRISAVVLLVLVTLAVADQLPGTQREFVTVAPPPPVTLHRGGTKKVELHFRVEPGFHINSSHPSSPLLIPTKLQLEPVTDLSIAKTSYPPGEELTLAFDPNEKLSVYTGDFAVTTMLAAVRSASPGIYKIHGNLKYQACDDRSCFPPKSLPVAIEVRVVKASR